MTFVQFSGRTKFSEETDLKNNTKQHKHLLEIKKKSTPQ